jgi:hypothetical protein
VRPGGSKESANHPGYKQRLVDARATDLVETELFDPVGNAATSLVVVPPIPNATFEPFDLLVERAKSRELILQTVGQLRRKLIIQ